MSAFPETLLHKMKREGTLPNTFYVIITIQKSKPEKDTTNKEKYRPLCLMSIVVKIVHSLCKLKSHTSKNTWAARTGLHGWKKQNGHKVGWVGKGGGPWRDDCD